MLSLAVNITTGSRDCFCQLNIIIYYSRCMLLNSTLNPLRENTLKLLTENRKFYFGYNISYYSITQRNYDQCLQVF